MPYRYFTKYAGYNDKKKQKKVQNLDLKKQKQTTRNFCGSDYVCEKQDGVD